MFANNLPCNSCKHRDYSSSFCTGRIHIEFIQGKEEHEKDYNIVCTSYEKEVIYTCT